MGRIRTIGRDDWRGRRDGRGCRGCRIWKGVETVEDGRAGRGFAVVVGIWG